MLVGLLSFYVLAIVARVAANPGDWLTPTVVIVSLLAFTWVLFAFYWARAQLRVRAVRRLLPDAVLFELVMTMDLSIEVMGAEQALAEPAPRIWPQTYLTCAVTRDALWFFGGSFRAVQRGRIPADRIRGVTVKIVAFPTRTVTRHLPALVVDVEPGSELEILPIRTTFLLPRKLTPAQLAAATRDVASRLGVPLN